MSRKTYRLKLIWIGGRVSISVPFTSRRKAEQAMRRFREVALMDRVELLTEAA